MTYADFSMCFSRRAYLFGAHEGPWGLVQWQPNITTPDTATVAQFYGTDLNPTSGELMVKSGFWIYNNGFKNSDGSFNHIKVIGQRTGGHPGQPPEGVDITDVGGVQTYALWNIPDYNYWIWTKGKIEQSEFAHSQWWGVPRMVTNPFWHGEGSNTRLCIEMREEWYEGNPWAMTHCRTCYLALDTGTIWLCIDHLNSVEYGMILAWDY